MFLLWTLVLYWTHRAAHLIPYIRYFHLNHHFTINRNLKNNCLNTWHWNNLLLYNDNCKSTFDLWITEVIPTIIFCAITTEWWILGFYYVWAALIQESIEHNPNVNLPLLMSGKKHLVHHKNSNKNYGLLFSFWDKIFRTYKHV